MRGRGASGRRVLGRGTGRRAVGGQTRGAYIRSDRRLSSRAATRPCWPTTLPRGQLRHGHDCYDTAPVRSARGHARSGRRMGVLDGLTGPS